MTVLGLQWGITRPTPRPAVESRGGVERCTYTAACPRCGHDCGWVSVRIDTRVTSKPGCNCGGAA